MSFIPEKKTCETCDWWCYGTYADNTCDKWEHTIFVADIPEEVLRKAITVPTLDDLQRMEQELNDIF